MKTPLHSTLTTAVILYVIARGIPCDIFKHTSLAIGAVVTIHTRAVVGVNVIITCSSIFTRNTGTFVDVCNVTETHDSVVVIDKYN